MEVTDFEILLIHVIFILEHVWKRIFSVLIKCENPEYNRDRRLKGWSAKL